MFFKLDGLFARISSTGFINSSLHLAAIASAFNSKPVDFFKMIVVLFSIIYLDGLYYDGLRGY